MAVHRGLADLAAKRFRSHDWPVGEAGNYNREVLGRSTVFYGPGQQAAALRFAKEVGVPRVLARTNGLPAGLSVILPVTSPPESTAPRFPCV